MAKQERRGGAAARASDTGARGIRRPEELSFRAGTAWGMPLLTDGDKVSADRWRVNLSRSEFTISLQIAASVAASNR